MLLVLFAVILLIAPDHVLRVHATGVVHECTPQTLPDLTRGKLTMVLFYGSTKFCQYCPMLKTVWQSAATIFENQTDVKFVQCDASLYQELLGTYSFTQFPAYRVFRERVADSTYRYTSMPDLTHYVRRELKPLLQDLNSEEELATFKSHFPIVVVLHTASKDDLSYVQFYQQAKRYGKDISFGAHFHGDMSATDGLVILYNSVDQRSVTYTDGKINNATAFGIWLARESFLDATEFTEVSFKPLLARELPLVQFFFNESVIDEVLAIARGIGAAFRHNVTVVYSTSGEEGKGRMQTMGLSGIKYPSVAIDDIVRPRFAAFPEEEAITMDSLQAFVDAYLNRTLRRSEHHSLIANQQSPDILTIVGKSFQKEVLESPEDVLLLMSSPKCEISQNFQKIFDEFVADRKEKKVPQPFKIVYMNLLTNEPPEEFPFPTFPTVYYVKKQNGSVVERVRFEGKHTMEDINDFINKNTVVPPSDKQEL